MVCDCIALISTLSCNNDCQFCARQLLNSKYIKDEIKNVNMSIETAKKILDSSPKNAGITVTGGEPFLNLPLIEFLLSLPGRRVTIYTNGSIRLPENTVFNNDRTRFNISVNNFMKIPELYKQINIEAQPVEMIANIYMDKDLDKVETIIKRICFNRGLKGYKLLYDIWTDDREIEEKIKFVKKCAKMMSRYVKYNRDIGLKGYLLQEPEGRCTRYGPDGAISLSLYGTGIKDPIIQQKINELSYSDKNIFCFGREKIKMGREAFKAPIEYLMCIYYEELAKWSGLI